MLSSEPAVAPAQADTVRPDIQGLLAAQGYELRKLEHEGRELEAYAMKDGVLWELTLDPDTGDILRVELED